MDNTTIKNKIAKALKSQYQRTLPLRYEEHNTPDVNFNKLAKDYDGTREELEKGLKQLGFATCRIHLQTLKDELPTVQDNCTFEIDGKKWNLKDYVKDYIKKVEEYGSDKIYNYTPERPNPVSCESLDYKLSF
ncbi:hypothetical protein DY052_06400 [Apilactobacillus timberlakei]|uniref:hypothetical protein n=1 Tax=Apilactobacillus timberlakei TaxID=2008380 RepID=UPI00112C8319|nr:hypothetical protein [Apilactobacillus timberlakei]TPR15055.1 hypothetical protein DY052_06400 [Apilactobacillus timberlakei]